MPEAITKYDIRRYINWVFNDCNAPHDELESIIQYALQSDSVSVENLIKSIIKTITKQ